MATYNVHAGHNWNVPGANGIFSETKEDRIVKDKVIALLRKEGHTVYDCTDESGRTDNQNLVNIVNKCNQHRVTLDVSIHFNAFNGAAHGVEVLQYDSATQGYSQRIVNNIAALGFTNRGVKDGSWLYVCSNTISPAILIECCFCDSAADARLYNSDTMAKAIVEGILNKKISGSTGGGSVTTAPETNQVYRIRKTWADAKSQVGAYRNLESAKQQCPKGYSVFDWNGKVVYSNNPTPAPQKPVDVLYRVRKTWADVKSQLGAYKSLDNAKNNCPVGYSVFDSNGKVVYSPASAPTPQPTPQKPVEPTVKPEVKPEPQKPTEQPDISPIKGLGQQEFIEYIGAIAKADMKESGVLASVTIAQAILESAYGQSELSLKANNLFGMKASLSGNNWTSKWDGKKYAKVTKEENSDGTIVDLVAEFRAYPSPKDSIIDHSNYLVGAKNGTKLRYEGLVGEKNYRKAIQIIKDGGYATDSKYVDKVCEIIERYKLDSWDHALSPSELDDIREKIDYVSGIVGKIFDVVNNIYKLLKTVFNR